jgi:Fur family peroxide stress response transcriptional regulator
MMRERGLRLTAQRMAVLEYLLSTDEHPSARRVFEKVRKSLPGIALSTVYGILAELTKNGIIKALEFNERDNRYEANLSQHINLVCLRCGKISDYVTPYTRGSGTDSGDDPLPDIPVPL